MKKALKYLAWITGSLIGLILLAWLGLAVYVLVQKPTLIEKARTELKARVGPASNLGDIDISFFSHFPHITLHISRLALRDSLWERHHHDLLTAENSYIRLDELGSIFSGKIRVGKVYLQQGSIYLFTDSLGYSNTSAFHSSSGGPKNDDPHPSPLPGIELSDIRFVMEQQPKKKLFDLEIRRLNCGFRQDGRQLDLDIDMNSTVKNFAFNIEKGSFMKDKALAGHFHVKYNTGSKILQADKASVLIGGHPFVLSGRFFPDVHPDPFNLNIETENVLFADATALLTPALQQKLDGYHIDRPINISALVDAGAADNPKALINVRINTAANSINTPAGRFNNVSFKGSFSNEWVRGQSRNDSNSIIRLLNFSGTREAIPIRADTITITNLKHPTLSCDIHSSFDIARLNSLSGSRDIHFDKGFCKVDVRYKGPIVEKDSIPAALYGSLDVDSGTVSYLPYHLELTGCNGRVRFDNQDVQLQKLQVHAGSTKLLINGVARGVVALLDPMPDNISMDLRLMTANLDLEDLSTLAGRPAETPASGKGSSGLLSHSGSRLDRMIRDGAIHLALEAVDMHYKKFRGAHAKAELLFTGNEIRLQHLQLEQGVGSMSASGTLLRIPGDGNPLSFKSHMESVDLPGLFAEFNNFGQPAIRDKNLKGRLTADIAMTGRMTDKGNLVPGSLKGSIDFSIRGGQLIDFEPMEKIHQAVLKKRDLSEIHFAELASRLDLDSTTFQVHRMEIQSTAFTLFAEGVYDTKTGPDMSLLVPLSNLKERNTDIPPANKGNDSKAGPSIRLRARNGDDGKLKISWDPFKKALRQKRKA